jgi:hypothetical protein
MDKDQIRKEKRPMLVKDIPENFELVTESQEIGSIADNLGIDLDDYGCLFVEVLEGEYGQVYGCSGSVPYLMDTAYLIKG